MGILLGVMVTAGAQKSRVLSVFQMIEAGKYEEAKEAIELAVWNDKTSKWPRTYYAKGLLCQKAFESGFEKNDTKKTNLYPDQLVVAYNAYQKALELDSGSRLTSTITQLYYSLANDFQQLGTKHYAQKEYTKALGAFEHALLISKSPLLSVDTDTSLVYNTAMAAYEAGNWEKAISYLTGLNDDGFSANVALLLYKAHVNNGERQLGEEVLLSAVEKYNSDEQIIMQLVDLLVETNRAEQAVQILDSALVSRPDYYPFPWTRGLILQRINRYDRAIESLYLASKLAPEEAGIYYDLGICYYNRGVEINESARQINNNAQYQATRKEATEQFQEAVKWLEKAYEMDADDQQTISRLYQLYYQLQMTEKQQRMERLIR